MATMTYFSKIYTKGRNKPIFLSIHEETVTMVYLSTICTDREITQIAG
jgi:hypothetical protein